MEEKFGVGLELKENAFTSKMKEIASKAQDFSDVLKDRFKFGANFDITESKTKLNELMAEYEKLKNATASSSNASKMLSEYGSWDNAIARAQSLKTQIESLNNKINQFEGDKVSQLGHRFEQVKNAVTPAKQEVSKLGNIVEQVGKKITSSFKGAKKSASDMNSSFKTSSKLATDFGKNVEKTFSKGLSNIKRFALSLFGIQSIWRAVSRAVSSYMAMDSQLSKQMQSTWAGFGSMFAPILEYLISLFAKLLAYVNALVKALFGIDFVARANAKALDKQSGSAQKASKALAGFDEITNLNNQSGGGGGGADIPSIELPKIDDKVFKNLLKIVEKIKKELKDLFKPFKDAWANEGKKTIDSAKYAFDSTKDAILAVGSSFKEVWTNGTGQEIMENTLRIWQDIFTIIGNVGVAFREAWENDGNGTAIIQNLTDTFKEIQRFVLLIGDSIKKWTVSEGFKKSLNFVMELWRDITGWIKEIAKWIVDMYEKYFKPVIDEKIIPLLGDVADMFKAIWAVAKPIIDKIIQILKNVLEPVIKGIADTFGGIITVLRGIIQFITGVFTGDWKKAWKGIKNVFKGIVDALVGIFKIPINLIIKGINKFIDGINSIKIPDWVPSVGGKGFNIKHLTMLDTGTNFVPQDTLAMVHQGEAVVPKKFNNEKFFGKGNDETNSLLRELIQTLEAKDMNAYIAEDIIGRSSVSYINSQKRIMGGSPI